MSSFPDALESHPRGLSSKKTLLSRSNPPFLQRMSMNVLQGVLWIRITLMRMRIRIRNITLMRIQIRIQIF